MKPINLYDIQYEVDIQEKIFNIKPKLVLIDKNVYESFNIESESRYVIEISEETKNYDKYLEVIKAMDESNVNRDDIVMIIGGGVLLDVAGFACTTYKRGVGRINVPTTLLAMVDASIGGKCGINYNGQKNIIGSISMPLATIINTAFFQTLNQREFDSGMAEIIKVAVLDNSSNLLNLLEENKYEIIEVIEKAIEIKKKFVKDDIHDFGKRRFLNLAHTYAHAIESYYNFDKYLHGEAVALGLVLASNYNERIIKILSKNNLPIFLDSDIDVSKLVTYMMKDKKNETGMITHIVLNELFNPSIERATKQEMERRIKQFKVLPKAQGNDKIIINNSKSLLHRTLIVSLLKKATYKIKYNKQVDLSDDILTTINILKGCNILVELHEQYIYVDSLNIKLEDTILNFHSSATSLRVMLPILACLFGNVKFTMSKQLESRPIDEIGQYYSLKKQDDYYVLVSRGLEVELVLDGSISSQYVSGYLFALVYLNEDRVIKIKNITSLNYIYMTMNVLKEIGADIKFEVSSNLIYVYKVKELSLYSIRFVSEVDYSNYAFFAVYNKLCEINGVNRKYEIKNEMVISQQADYCIIDILEKEKVEIDMEGIPDLLPILMVYGALNKKGIKLNKIKRIKHKESNRIMVMKENLEKLGVSVEYSEQNDYIVVKSTKAIKSGVIKTYDDHRIAMSFGIFNFFTSKTIVIDNPDCVRKSYPRFWDFLLGVQDVNVR